MSPVLQSKQVFTLKMVNTSNISFCGTGIAQSSSSTMSVSILHVCGHTSTNSVTFTPDTPTLMILNGPCSNAECQAKSLVDLIGPRACFADNESRFIKTMTANFQLAGMNCESALRQFSLVEPMLVEEMEMMGCSPSIVQALLGSGAQQRMNTTAVYLGHRPALATLAQFKNCVQNYGSQRVASTVAQEIQALHEAVQKKLIALQQAVFSLSQNSYAAPGAPFHMLEGIQTFEQGWGKTELKMLRSCKKARMS